MKNLAMSLCVVAMAAVGCVTSERIDLDAGNGNVVPIMTGAAGQTSTGQAGTTGSSTGNGGNGGSIVMNTTGSAGASGGAGTSGAAGASGGAGTTGTAGQGGGGGSSSGGKGGSGIDGGTNTDAKPMTDASAGDGPVSLANPTWTDIYSKFFVNMAYASNCTGGACHDPGTQKGIDFSTQAKGYTTIKSHLVVGNPTSSQLVQKLSSGSMPAGRPKMPTVDLNVVKTWIMMGAMNN